MGYGEAKKLLLEKIDAYFGPARVRRKELAANPQQVEEVLKRGAQKARAEAQQTMALGARGGRYESAERRVMVACADSERHRSAALRR